MWFEVAADNDYEIYSEYPHQIRRISNQRIIKESVKNDDYIRVRLNQRICLKHRLIAETFIPNPNNFLCVDHINHIRSDNRLGNLRFVSYKENCNNKSGMKNITYEYVNEIPNDSMVIDYYGEHELEDYYYNDNVFYFHNGINFRKLHVNEDKKGNKWVNMTDTEGKYVKCYYSVFKRKHDLI